MPGSKTARSQRQGACDGASVYVAFCIRNGVGTQNKVLSRLGGFKRSAQHLIERDHGAQNPKTFLGRVFSFRTMASSLRSLK